MANSSLVNIGGVGVLIGVFGAALAAATFNLPVFTMSVCGSFNICVLSVGCVDLGTPACLNKPKLGAFVKPFGVLILKCCGTPSVDDPADGGGGKGGTGLFGSIRCPPNKKF